MAARVIDASVMVAMIRDGGRFPWLEPGTTARVPQIFDLEVASALRRLVRADEVAGDRAQSALRGLAELRGLTRHSHVPLLPRIWQLRDNFTSYDAAYVALAELLGIPFVTLDGRLAKAAAAHCTVELID